MEDDRDYDDHFIPRDLGIGTHSLEDGDSVAEEDEDEKEDDTCGSQSLTDHLDKSVCLLLPEVLPFLRQHKIDITINNPAPAPAPIPWKKDCQSSPELGTGDATCTTDLLQLLSNGNPHNPLFPLYDDSEKSVQAAAARKISLDLTTETIVSQVQHPKVATRFSETLWEIRIETIVRVVDEGSSCWGNRNLPTEEKSEERSRTSRPVSCDNASGIWPEKSEFDKFKYFKPARLPNPAGICMKLNLFPARFRYSRFSRSNRSLESSIPPDIGSLLKSRTTTWPLELQLTPLQVQQSVVTFGFQDTSFVEAEELNWSFSGTKCFWEHTIETKIVIYSGKMQANLSLQETKNVVENVHSLLLHCQRTETNVVAEPYLTEKATKMQHQKKKTRVGNLKLKEHIPSTVVDSLCLNIFPLYG
ncbi:hypothetical protein Ccrd_026107, partial [Cynara cardunculus var. scolymus]